MSSAPTDESQAQPGAVEPPTSELDSIAQQAHRPAGEQQEEIAAPESEKSALAEEGEGSARGNAPEALPAAVVEENASARSEAPETLPAAVAEDHASARSEAPETLPAAIAEASTSEPIHAMSPQSEDLASLAITIDSSDADSSIDNLSYRSTTTSLHSSVLDYVHEDGRTYHRYREGTYLMPNDDTEQERLDLQHQLWLLTLEGKLHLAPIKSNPENVLDIGTGTGIWAIDFADTYRTASVVGNDLSPIQPNLFIVEDSEDEWQYEEPFDFIHGRLLVSCFKDPRVVFRQAFKHLKPGGYFEMQDANFPMRCVDASLTGTPLEEWNRLVKEGADKAQRSWTRTKYYKSWLTEAGFVDIEERQFIWPINPWPKNPHLKVLGRWFQQDLLEVLNSSKAFLTRGLGWTSEQVEVFLVNVRKDVQNKGVHAYVTLSIFWARKPES